MALPTGVDDGVAGAARCAWTGGRSGGVAHRASAGWAAVLRPVPSPRQTTTVLWGGEGGPSAGALVQAAVRPGAVLRRLRARPSEACTHLCAEPEHVVGVWDGAGVGNPAVVWAKNQHACAKTRGSFVGRNFHLSGKQTPSHRENV